MGRGGRDERAGLRSEWRRLAVGFSSARLITVPYDLQADYQRFGKVPLMLDVDWYY